MTPSESDDWTDVSRQNPTSADDHEVKPRTADNYVYNLGRCEGIVIGLLDRLYGTNTTSTSLQCLDESRGHKLLRHACKVLIDEKIGHDHDDNGMCTDEKSMPQSEQDKMFIYASHSVIDAMSKEINDRDIATLVFEWTTLDVFDDFKRV